MPRHRSAKTASQNGLHPLSPRERNFVGEYLIDLHGTKAAIRAGYSPRSAAVQASDLLKRPHIIAAIQERRNCHAKRLDVSAERILDELASCAFSNMQDFWPAPGEHIDLSTMERRLTAAVQSIKIKETLVAGEDGKPAMLERQTELKLYNKIAALEKLGNHLGLFEGEKKDSLVDRVRKMTPEQRVARMKEIMRIARERYGHLIEHEEQKDAQNHPDHSAA
jgi:phage terminase small subunit